MSRLPSTSPLFPTRRSSDLAGAASAGGSGGDHQRGWLSCPRGGGGQEGPRPAHAGRFPQGRCSPPRTLRAGHGDRKSTRLNSSHRCISYAVFCLKKKIKIISTTARQEQGSPKGQCVVVWLRSVR